MTPFRLYLITDRTRCADLAAAVESALAAVPPGAAAVQLREKDLGARDLLELARRLVPICKARSAPLLVNDRIDVAIVAGADGVHLTSGSIGVDEARRLLPRGALVAASAHGLAEVEQRAGADFVVFGPVGETPGKGAPLGFEALRDATASGAAVYALGGIDAGTAAAARRAGARGVAAIRAWLNEDPGAAAAGLLAAWDRP